MVGHLGRVLFFNFTIYTHIMLHINMSLMKQYLNESPRSPPRSPPRQPHTRSARFKLRQEITYNVYEYIESTWTSVGSVRLQANSILNVTVDIQRNTFSINNFKRSNNDRFEMFIHGRMVDSAVSQTGGMLLTLQPLDDTKYEEVNDLRV